MKGNLLYILRLFIDVIYVVVVKVYFLEVLSVLAKIVTLRSRSRLVEGQMRVRKVKETKDLDLSYTLFLVFTHHHHHPPHTFFWL